MFNAARRSGANLRLSTDDLFSELQSADVVINSAKKLHIQRLPTIFGK